MPAAMMLTSRPTLMEGNYNSSWTVEGFGVSSVSILDADEKSGVSIANIQVNLTQKSIRELLYNGTGYYIEDEMEPGG